MRILITGPSGFIGRHTVAAASALGHVVVPWRRRDGWFDRPHARAALDGTDAVIHLAGRFPEQGGRSLALLDAFRANVEPTAVLLDACERVDIRRVVLASTAQVYHPCSTPIQTESSRNPGRTAYAASKLCAEALVRAHGGISLRLFNVYGPGQSPYNVFMTIARQALEKDPVRILDDRPVRDFVHVADVARAFVAAAHQSDPLPDTVNIGTGHGTSIQELARLILDSVGRHDSATAGNRDDTVVDSYIADITLARDALGFYPEVELERGISDTIACLRAAKGPIESHRRGRS